MPPRQSKRAKAPMRELPAEQIEIVYELHRKKGILAFPSELLLEIVSHFTEISIEEICKNPRTLPVHYRERFGALRTLSQTCKELRTICLPLAWERLEACTNSGPDASFFKVAGELLERKCNGLLKSKHLLPHVRYA